MSDGPSPSHVAPARLRAWGELLRLPNLLTVPGDPLAGFVLASLALGAGPVPLARLLAALAASGLLYMAGLINNDLHDLAEDRRDRPGRPLPSGRVRVVWAMAAYNALFVAALLSALFVGSAGLVLAAGLLGMILAYNNVLKRVPLVGPLAMGSCRGLSLLVGAAAAGNWAGALAEPVLLSAAALTLYVAAVTAIAAGETLAQPLALRRWLPAVVVLAWLAAVQAMLGEPLTRPVSLALSALAVGWAIRNGLALGGTVQPARAQRTVGALLRGLLLIQAALVATGSGAWLAPATALVLFWPVNAMLARVFPPS